MEWNDQWTKTDAAVGENRQSNAAAVGGGEKFKLFVTYSFLFRIWQKNTDDDNDGCNDNYDGNFDDNDDKNYQKTSNY